MLSLEPNIPKHPSYEDFSEFHPLRAAIDFYDSNGDRVKVYPITNELDTHESLRSLAHLAPLGNSMITLSGIQGLEQFAARASKVTYLFHIDLNRGEKILWRIFLESIYRAENPDKAIDLILTTVKDEFKNPRVYGKLDKYFKGPIHLFKFDSAWETLKKALKEGRVFSLSLDLAIEARVEQFCALLIKHCFTPDTLYVSNLRGDKWLGPQVVQSIIQQFRKINGSESLYVIHAITCNCVCSTDIVQRVEKVSSTLPLSSSTKCLLQVRHRILLILDILATLKLTYMGIRKGSKLEDVLPEDDYFALRSKILRTKAFNQVLSENLGELSELLIDVSLSVKPEPSPRSLQAMFPELRESQDPAFFEGPLLFAINAVAITVIRNEKKGAGPVELGDLPAFESLRA